VKKCVGKRLDVRGEETLNFKGEGKKKSVGRGKSLCLEGLYKRGFMQWQDRRGEGRSKVREGDKAG